jgi:AraC family transcriptional regulator
VNPVEKALWFIENRLSVEVSLQTIAADVGVSSHHLARAFDEATGTSVMRYARRRRLSEAARALVDGAPDILSVALDAGYGSHEAFTRAFREHFGVTPESCRAGRTLQNLQLVEPIRMDKSLMIELPPPRFEDGEGLLIVGLSARYRFSTNEGIPAQWRRFAPFIGAVPRQRGPETYGVSHNFDDDGEFDYVAGVRVSSLGEIADELAALTIPAHRYAVFTHRGHVSMLRRTHYTIWNKWQPEAGLEIANAPNFERYG